MKMDIKKEYDILVINGPSSSGKSVIARELQRTSQTPLFHLSIDTFYTFVENRFHDDFKLTSQIIMPSLYHSAAIFAKNGGQVILDLVFFETQWFIDCKKVLENYTVKWVGLHCPLNVLEKRERLRGDRIQGLARSMIKRVHSHPGLSYDFEIMTDTISPEAAAFEINRCFQ